MKLTVTLLDPEERHEVDVDAWARLMFERNASKHGLPPIPAREAMQRFPESFLLIASFYVLRRHGAFTGTMEDYELRWGGVDTAGPVEAEEGGLPDPTTAAV